jgi:hypothetical protein
MVDGSTLPGTTKGNQTSFIVWMSDEGDTQGDGFPAGYSQERENSPRKTTLTSLNQTALLFTTSLPRTIQGQEL